MSGLTVTHKERKRTAHMCAYVVCCVCCGVECGGCVRGKKNGGMVV